MSKLTVELDQSHGRGMDLLRIGGAETITPLVLIEVSDLCLERYKACDDKNKLLWHMLHEKARDIVNHDACPEEGVPILAHFIVEGFDLPRPGEEVTVIKGATVRTFHPSAGRKPRVSKRRQRVRVDHVIGGYVDFHHGLTVRSPEVRWAGSGGYWTWVHAHEVELHR